MNTPRSEVEKAKTMLEDYKERVANGEHFPTWEEVRKGFNFTPEEEKQMERQKKKILAKIEKKNTKRARKTEKKAKDVIVKA